MKKNSPKTIIEYVLGSASIAVLLILSMILRLKSDVSIKDFLLFTTLQLLISVGAFFLISTVSKDFLTRVLGTIALISSQSVIYVFFDIKSLRNALAYGIALVSIALALKVLYGEKKIYLYIGAVLLLSGLAYLSINDFVLAVGTIFLLFILSKKKEWLILSLCPLFLSIPAFVRYYLLAERSEVYSVFYQPIQIPSVFIYRDNLPGLGLGCCLLLIVSIYVFFINQTKDENSFAKKSMIIVGLLILLSLDIPFKNVINSLLYLRGVPVVSAFKYIEYATVLMVLSGCQATDKIVKEEDNKLIKRYIQIFIIVLSGFAMIYTTNYLI